MTKVLIKILSLILNIFVVALLLAGIAGIIHLWINAGVAGWEFVDGWL